MAFTKNIKKDEYIFPNSVQLVKGGKYYFNLLVSLINRATESIHLQTYIFQDDETGQLVGAALKAAARKNIAVYLLVDGYASQSISTLFINDLKSAGIHFRFFQPLLKSRNFYFGRRMHHKIAVVDARFALVGGINIANKYNDFPEQPAWLDFALYAEGAIAKDICVLCWKTWNNFPEKMGLTPCEEKQLIFNFNGKGTSGLRMRRNDWVHRKNEISASYIELFRTAQSHIIILCSYFLPGRVIRRLLSRAAKRGVHIKVITAGQSDIIMAKYAERWLYDWLLRNNVELYEYQPSVLHAKIAVSDTAWATIGSYNINDISAYASIELNIDIQDNIFVQALTKQLDTLIQNDCIPITHEYHVKTKNIFKQFLRWFSYQFIRVAFHLFTFYFKQRR